MATFEYDGSADPDFLASLEAEQADSERIGGEIQEAEQSLLAGKFATAEELERGYIELQQLLGRKGETNESTEKQTEPEAEEPEEEEPEEEEDDSEIDLASYLVEEFATNGELSEQTLAALSQYDAGEVAAALLAAQPAPSAVNLSDADQAALQGTVGGPEAYAELVTWAKQSIPQGEIDAYNAVMGSGDPNAIYWAMQGLNSRYRAEAGYEGRLLDRTRPPKSVGDVFRSQAEVQVAMNDPRYDSDPAYRQDVFNKLERSNLDYS